MLHSYKHSYLVVNFISKLGFHRFSRFVTDEHHFQMHPRRQNTICVNCARLLSPIVARTLLDFGGRPSVLATFGESGKNRLSSVSDVSNRVLVFFFLRLYLKNGRWRFLCLFMCIIYPSLYITTIGPNLTWRRG